MAACTEFFIAAVADAETLRRAGGGPAFPSIELQGIGLVDVLHLGSLLTKTTCLPETVLEATASTPVSVTKVCRELLDALPLLSAAPKRAAIAADWKKGTPHFSAVPVEVLDEVLLELAGLAALARREGKELLELHAVASRG